MSVDIAPTKIVNTTEAAPGVRRCSLCAKTWPPTPTPVVNGTACVKCGHTA